MARTKKRGPGPSHVLITPDHAGNVVGVDPHKQTLTATVIDPVAGSSLASTSGSLAMGIGRWRRGRGVRSDRAVGG